MTLPLVHCFIKEIDNKLLIEIELATIFILFKETNLQNYVREDTCTHTHTHTHKRKKEKEKEAKTKDRILWQRNHP